MTSHDIDYKIIGDDIQFVEIELDPGETVIAEAGAMVYMEEPYQGPGTIRQEQGEGSGFNTGIISRKVSIKFSV